MAKSKNVEFDDANGIASGFAFASIFSKGAFACLTPLLVDGAKRTLEITDVPELAPRDCAEWPGSEELTCFPHKGGGEKHS